jgi:type IV pilus assembly protein PilB
MSSDLASHWLLDVAAAAGVEGMSLPADPSFPELDGAWERVGSALRLAEPELAARIATHFRLPLADLENVQRKALALVPREVATTAGVLPLRIDGETLVLATADPVSPRTRERISSVSGRGLRFELAGPRGLAEALTRHYSDRRYTEATLRELLAEASVEDPLVVRGTGTDMPAGFSGTSPAVAELVRRVFRYAAGREATDIHVEPWENGGRVRLRVDGVIQPLLTFPQQAMDRIVARIRELGGLENWENTPGQEAHFREEIEGRPWEVRLKTSVVPEGQKLVLRLFDRRAQPSLKRLGYPAQEAERLEQLLSSREGVVLLAGPSRSGKTTLLYSTLSHLANGDRTVASLENPVELQLPEVTQLNFDRNAWPAYHVALQDMLHQDADVIGAGELRDLHTARTVIRAGVTGHLVLASVHAPDTVSAVGRLRDLGLDAGRVAESLRGVIAQRLVRRLCPSCSRPVERREDLPEKEQELVRVFGAAPVRAAVGCPQCGNTGYRGQLACAEVLVVNEVVSPLVAEEAPLVELEAAAVAQGMRRMLHVALDRVERGETTLSEVARVFGEESAPGAEDGEERRVLVVDDDPVARLLVRTILEGQGLQVEEVTDGPTALKLLEGEHRFAAMVLDLMMPGMDGREVLREVRRSFRTYALPVVVLTSSGDLDDEISLLEAGADDFVQKPVDPRRLTARIRAVTRRAGAPLLGG